MNKENLCHKHEKNCKQQRNNADNCKHNHEEANHHHGCGCKHEHEEAHHHGGCDCKHEHEEAHHHDGCGCKHEHEEAHHHDGCGCNHEHGAENVPVVRLIIGGVIFAVAFILHLKLSSPLVIIPFIAAYLLLGYDIIINAVKGTVSGHILDENFLMSIASIGAFIIGEFPEAVAVMLFYRVGEALQDAAVDKSRESITKLMDIRPDYANINKNGEIIQVDPKSVKIGDTIIIKNGEKVPLDGKVSNGSTSMDTVALTGESMPRSVEFGDTVLSGFINKGATISVEVTTEYSDSTVARILEITEHARERKAQSEKFITVFAKYYTPIVVIIAVLLAFIPPIIFGNISQWIYRALIFLVVSCPCALVVSIPLGFFAGIGAASKKGILIKGSSYLEALAKLKTVVFDKTGTLTKGTFEVTDTKFVNDENLLIKAAAYAESYSNHPIASSIIKYYGHEIDRSIISDYEEISGMGISVNAFGKSILCGSIRLMNENKIYVPDTHIGIGTVIYVAIDHNYEGCITISDVEKDDSIITISALSAKGIDTVMLTGDTKESALNVSEHLGIDKTYYQLLPQDKVSRMEQTIKNNKGVTAFVGDGINDAPVLALADVGIAMGALGSDSAVEAADIVLMTDEPSKIIEALKISHKTMRIVKENIIFAIGVKLIILLLGALGITGMWPAIFADVGVALIAVLNSLRALR